MRKFISRYILSFIFAMVFCTNFVTHGHCKNSEKFNDIYFDKQISILKTLDISTLRNDCKHQLQAIIDSAEKYDFENLFDIIVVYNHLKCDLSGSQEPLYRLMEDSYMFRPETKERPNIILNKLKQNADNGDLNSIYILGAYYVNKNFPQYNLKTGIQLLSRAANKGNIQAQYHLGVLYSDENSPFWDCKKSLKYYKMAAKQGDMDANYEIGLAYYEGIGVKINESTALKYFFVAANKGEEDAAFYVAAILYATREKESRQQEAYFWIKVAEHMKSEVIAENMELLAEIEKNVTEEIKINTTQKVEQFIQNLHKE